MRLTKHFRRYAIPLAMVFAGASSAPSIAQPLSRHSQEIILGTYIGTDTMLQLNGLNGRHFDDYPAYTIPLSPKEKTAGRAAQRCVIDMAEFMASELEAGRGAYFWAGKIIEFAAEECEKAVFRRLDISYPRFPVKLTP